MTCSIGLERRTIKLKPPRNSLNNKIYIINGSCVSVLEFEITKNSPFSQLSFFSCFSFGVLWIYEARTRHQRCRTRVRCGRTRRRAEDAATRASGRVVPCVFHVLLADSCRCSSDSSRLARIWADSGLNRPESAISAETDDSGRN